MFALSLARSFIIIHSASPQSSLLPYESIRLPAGPRAHQSVGAGCIELGLTIKVARRVTTEDGLDQLTQLFIQRRIPDYIRSDNGSEFTAKTVRQWLDDLGVNHAPFATLSASRCFRVAISRSRSSICPLRLHNDSPKEVGLWQQSGRATESTVCLPRSRTQSVPLPATLLPLPHRSLNTLRTCGLLP